MLDVSQRRDQPDPPIELPRNAGTKKTVIQSTIERSPRNTT